MHPTIVVSAVIAWGLSVMPCAGQDLRLLECSAVSFWGPACLPPAPTLPPVAAEPTKEPLFTPQTMAPDVPPLMVRLLEEPSEANALAYIAWQTERSQRIQEVQQLLKALTKEAP